ncbi:hypothetical protein [Amycolatopsis aidingensis]|uniref:hypothetical protein n=1 Tax=Amycolatopsis aidingensis TaxID=2842453 RepID=UPI001C0C2FDD|nr:hypothetical protein [Amycolatopsis aidingensis]
MGQTQASARPKVVSLVIEDLAGERWTASPSLTREPGSKATALGWIVALLLLGGSVFAFAGFLVWTVSVVRNWWAGVPELGYGVAVKLTGIVVLSVFVGTFIDTLAKRALGVRKPG